MGQTASTQTQPDIQSQEAQGSATSDTTSTQTTEPVSGQATVETAVASATAPAAATTTDVPIAQNDAGNGSNTDPQITPEDIIVDSEPKRKFTVSAEAKALLARELLKVEQANKQNTERKTLQGNLINRAVFDAQKDNLQELVLENKMLSESLEKYKKLYFDLRKLVDDLQTEVESSLDEVTHTLRASNNKASGITTQTQDV